MVALFCAAAPAAKYLVLDAGAYVDNIAQRLQAPDGYANDVSTLSGYFRLRRAVAIGHGRWGFEPGLSALFPWRSGRDGFQKTFTFDLNLDLTFDLWSFLTFRAGPGIEYQLLLAQGENIDLNNGSPTAKSTFFVPGGVTNSFLFTSGLGCELRLLRRLSLSADLWVVNIGSNPRRRYQGALSLGFLL